MKDRERKRIMRIRREKHEEGKYTFDLMQKNKKPQSKITDFGKKGDDNGD